MRSQRCRSKLSYLFRLAGRAGVTRQLGLPSMTGGQYQGPFGEREIFFPNGPEVSPQLRLLRYAC
jgi:hypothetical protein